MDAVFTKALVSKLHMLWYLCQEVFNVFIWPQVMCFGRFSYAVRDGAEFRSDNGTYLVFLSYTKTTDRLLGNVQLSKLLVYPPFSYEKDIRPLSDLFLLCICFQSLPLFIICIKVQHTDGHPYANISFSCDFTCLL